MKASILARANFSRSYQREYSFLYNKSFIELNLSFEIKTEKEHFNRTFNFKRSVIGFQNYVEFVFRKKKLSLLRPFDVFRVLLEISSLNSKNKKVGKKHLSHFRSSLTHFILYCDCEQHVLTYYLHLLYIYDNDNVQIYRYVGIRYFLLY